MGDGVICLTCGYEFYWNYPGVPRGTKYNLDLMDRDSPELRKVRELIAEARERRVGKK